ncbi:hypothetical protein E4U25_004442 [Claviceps purpurea]|nr:hypothetical protein E4U25_004442 [Claviceps purpurea]
MTEVGQADLSRLLQTRRIEYSAIVTSRKRKLRELFTVATHADTLPTDAFANPDAPAPTSAEWKFLQASDIAQGRSLNEINIPARHSPSLEKLQRWLASQVSVSIAQSSLPPIPAPPSIGDVKRKEPSVRPRSPTVPLNNGQGLSDSRSSFSPASSTPGPPVLSSQKASQSPGPSQTPKSTLLRPASVLSVEIPAKPKPQSSANVKTSTPPATPTSQPYETKVPPSIDTTKGGANQDATTSAIAEKAGDATVGAPVIHKAPTQWAKPAEPLSSPACTSYSATTPVLHPSSADTSPGHEDGPNFASKDPAERRRDGNAEVGSQDKALEAHELQNTTAAHAQPNLQGSESRTTTKDINDTTKLSSDDLSAQAKPSQAPGISKQAEREPTEPGVAAVDVPDSQDRSPESETVDGLAPPDLAQKGQKIASPRPDVLSQEAPSSPATSKKEDSLQSAQRPTTERAVTRVASGAMRAKSVSEIVGGSLSRQSSTLERDAAKCADNQQTGTPSTPPPPAPPLSASNMQLVHRRGRPKGQVSSVLFGKHPKRIEQRYALAGNRETMHASDDYYTPLFVHNFTGQSNWMQPIEKILFQANKTIATRDANLVLQDHQACRVLRRVYHLQQHDKWSLRQPKRIPEPTRPPAQWDVLLKEMKWMRTDFREERKWKMALARKLAYACSEWHEASPDERKQLQAAAIFPLKTVQRKSRPTKTIDTIKTTKTTTPLSSSSSPPSSSPSSSSSLSPSSPSSPATAAVVSAEPDVSTLDIEANSAENHPTPDLIHSEDLESPREVDEAIRDYPETVAPSVIFALQEDDVVFALRRTTASDALLDQLPMYGSPLDVPLGDITNVEYDPDAHWRRPALPLSKFVEGEMRVMAPKTPGKRSRFDYTNDDSGDDDDQGTAFDANQVTPHGNNADNSDSDDSDDNAQISPLNKEVALFHPDSKHIRERLHAGHQFRPPSEHPMPVQSFYECRGPSQWTVVEDDELRGLVREYSYNWSLISSMVSTKSRFQSAAERRSPWECFERWISLEGLPSDMQKTQYFKAYNTRIEAAQRVITQQNQTAVQQATASGGAVTPIRRRQSLPLRVERRRNQKHLTLIDAMRKLAKKRETTVQKQQHSAAQNSVTKKSNDTIAQRPKKTPREYSILRWERDQALAEKMAIYAQRQDAQRRAALQARAHGQAAAAAQAASAAGQLGAGGAGGKGGTGGVVGGTGAGGVTGSAGPTGQAAGAAQRQTNATTPQGGGTVTSVAARANIPSQLAAAAAAAAAQGRPRTAMQAPMTGVGVAGVGVQAQMNGVLSAPSQLTAVQQAQIQAALQSQQRMPVPNQQPDANLMLRAQRISEQQRAQIHQGQHQQQQQQQQLQLQQPQQQHQQHQQHQQQQQQHHQHQQHQQHQLQLQANVAAAAVVGHSSPQLRNGISSMNAINSINGISQQQNYMANAQAMMAQYGAATANATANGHTSPPPPATGLHMPASAMTPSPGPRMHNQLPPAIAAQLAALEGSFRAKNPSLSPEQARQLATEHLTRAMMAQRQSAMNSAAGTTGQSGLANSIAATTSPHQYAALLRQQQQQQAAIQQQAQQAQQAQQKAAQAAQAQHRATSQASPTPGPAASPARSQSHHRRQSSESATPGG